MESQPISRKNPGNRAVPHGPAVRELGEREVKNATPLYPTGPGFCKKNSSILFFGNISESQYPVFKFHPPSLANGLGDRTVWGTNIQHQQQFRSVLFFDFEMIVPPFLLSKSSFHGVGFKIFILMHRSFWIDPTKEELLRRNQ